MWWSHSRDSRVAWLPSRRLIEVAGPERDRSRSREIAGQFERPALDKEKLADALLPVRGAQSTLILLPP